MPNRSSRAAFVAAMLLLPGASASALTCVDDPARAETLAHEATAIVIGRVVPRADAVPAPADAASPSAVLSAFRAPPAVRELEIEAIETLKGEGPAGLFRARFLESPCAPMPPEGKRRILYLVHDDDGWRVLGSN